MRKYTSLVAVAVMMASIVEAQERGRMVGSHQHGHGTVNIATEGNSLLIELHAPGSDIVGFEHPARSDDDRQAVEKARTMLRDPQALFAIPANAGCRTEKATITLAGDAGHEHSGDHGADREHTRAEHDGHMEFHAEYALHCDRPAAIRELGFPFFKLFPRSRELGVTVITERGQATYEVGRDTPIIEIKQAP